MEKFSGKGKERKVKPGRKTGVNTNFVFVFKPEEIIVCLYADRIDPLKRTKLRCRREWGKLLDQCSSVGKMM